MTDAAHTALVATCRFMGLELETAPGALVPRSETELLGRTAVSLIADVSEPVVIDMCCGAGNLACAIAAARPDARVFGSDLTDETVALARRNVGRLALGNVEIVQADLFSALDNRGIHGRVDLIVCNPPYISTGRLAADRAHLLEKEPREAFDGGPYGISIHQRVIRDALPFLKAGGWLAMEFGEGQGRQLELLLKRASGYATPVFALEGDVPRVVMAQRVG
ncbi:N5-glutamine methyltransferase family protein [Alsobacter sp. R-9]